MRDENTSINVQAPPISARDYSKCCLALSSLQLNLVLSTPGGFDAGIKVSVIHSGIDKLTSSVIGMWECYASFGLKTRSEWALASTYRVLRTLSRSANPRLQVNLSIPSIWPRIFLARRMLFARSRCVSFERAFTTPRS